MLSGENATVYGRSSQLYCVAIAMWLRLGSSDHRAIINYSSMIAISDGHCVHGVVTAVLNAILA